LRPGSASHFYWFEQSDLDQSFSDLSELTRTDLVAAHYLYIVHAGIDVVCNSLGLFRDFEFR